MKGGIIFLLLFSQNVFSQLNQVYSYEVDKDKSLSIAFHSKGVYMLMLTEWLSEDIIADLYISYGKYSIHGKEIILTDYESGYKMTLTIVNQKLLFVKHSFRWMKDIYFHYEGESGSGVNSDLRGLEWDIDHAAVKKARKDHNHHFKDQIPLFFGEYTDQPLYLWIHPNHTYSLKFRDIPLSEGTWSRDNNVLILYDTSLKHNFYGLIEEKSIKSNQMPPSFNLYVYTYVEDGTKRPL